MVVHYLSATMLKKYQLFLQGEERSKATIQKYMRDIKKFLDFCGEKEMTKAAVIEFKEYLLNCYSAVSTNSILAAVNGFLSFMGWHECRVKTIKVQRSMYRNAQTQLTKQEYYQLVLAAEKKNNIRLSLVLQTICSTGIRVSELCQITYASVLNRKVEIFNKGKRRTVFLSQKLCKQLKCYCAKTKLVDGPVFVTKSGKPLDRSNIWHMMKALAAIAGVAPKKVFPHNLRHLFAECFYKLQKDLDHLASILGHSNINTTRIYTQTNDEEYCKQIEQLHLII